MLLVWRDQVPREGGPPINTSVSEREAAELGRLADGRRVLEVGAAYGYSTVVLALGGATQVVSVDPHIWLQSYGPFVANVNAYGVTDRVLAVQGDSYTALPQMVDRDERFDLVFIDGDHEESAVDFDVTWSRGLLAPDGILSCHDYGEDTCPGVRVALDRLLGPPPKLVDTLAIYEGLA